MHSNKNNIKRRLPVGAEIQDGGGVHFRVWATEPRQVEVVLEGDNGSCRSSYAIKMEPEDEGYFSVLVPDAAEGTLYRYRLDKSERLFPDPASRFQPAGPDGPSEVISPDKFPWSDGKWKGITLEGQVMYEMHIGTFTPEGTWESARRELKHLAEIGITVVEIMPVADFPGRFGWGYDGVNLFAPTQLYGRPDDMRRFVDTAHGLGMGVILDVVYNHVGSTHNYLAEFSPNYFSKESRTDWGNSINFDVEPVSQVREYFIYNAGYWIDEFHLDGLRFDATQNIYDESENHILKMITRHTRKAAKKRNIILVAESDKQLVRIIKPETEGGYGLDAAWNDDFHHSAMVAMTGHNEGYYTDFPGTPQEIISSLKWGYIYQGQQYKYEKRRRGTPSIGLNPAKFILYLQNHDQIANSAYGLRCQYLTSPGRYKAMTALLLLAPGTPLLFQGQEFAASAPFLFFADVSQELADIIYEGRKKSLARFESIADPRVQAKIAHPDDPATFERCKLDLSERETHHEMYQLHRDLLKIRRNDTAFKPGNRIDGAVLAAEAFVLRFFGNDGEDRLLLVNLGRDLYLSPVPEPLLAPPESASRWEIMLSTESPVYGGSGTRPLDTKNHWFIPGHAATLLRPAVD